MDVDVYFPCRQHTTPIIQTLPEQLVRDGENIKIYRLYTCGTGAVNQECISELPIK